MLKMCKIKLEEESSRFQVGFIKVSVGFQQNFQLGFSRVS